MEHAVEFDHENISDTELTVKGVLVGEEDSMLLGAGVDQLL